MSSTIEDTANTNTPGTNGPHVNGGRWLFVGAVLNLLLVGVLGYLTWHLLSENCERTVAAREGQRTMWLYLAEQNPDNPDVPAFLAELDKRLPAYKCVNGTPTPVTEPVLPPNTTTD
jgi:hypothetical protein